MGGEISSHMGCVISGVWDFLIPHLSEQGTLLSHEPLDYASALRIFRDMLYTPWKRFSGPHPLDEMQLNYTLHSAKATLLSFRPHLGSAVESDDRLQQGHHADPRKSLKYMDVIYLPLELKLVQPVERLSYHGECNLAY